MTLDEYTQALGNFTQSGDFLGMNDGHQQQAIKDFRSSYITDTPDADIAGVNAVTERQNVEYLRGTGKGRVIPTGNNIIFPNQEPGWQDLNQDQKRDKIEEFRNKAPEFSAANPTQKEDTEYYLRSAADELDRRNDGSDNGRVHSYLSSIGQGLVANLAEGIGAFDTAKSIRKWFNENPEFDQEWGQQISEGLGSAGSSIVIMAGLAATTKGLGGSAALAGAVGTSGSLVSNGLMRYNEGYQKAVQAGLDEDKAVEAGFSSTPAAFIDALSDKILASKLMPDRLDKVFSLGTSVEKKAAIAEIIKDNTLKGKLVEYSMAGLGEGVAEAGGDYVASIGPFLTQGLDTRPTDQESFRSFIIGGILGSGVNAAIDIKDTNAFTGVKGETEVTETDTGTIKTTPTFFSKTARDLTKVNRDLDAIDPSEQQSVYDLVAQGKYREASKLTETLLNSDPEDFTTPENDLDGVDDDILDVEAEDITPPNTDLPFDANENPKETSDKNNIISEEEKAKTEAAVKPTYQLASLAKEQGVELASMTREQYANFAIENKIPIGERELRSKPSSRIIENDEQRASSITPEENKKAETSYKKFVADIDKVSQTEKGQVAPGVVASAKNPDSNQWMYFNVNDGAGRSKKPQKVYASFSSLKSASPTKLKKFFSNLSAAGFNGQVKLVKDLPRLSDFADQMVMQGATKRDVDLALKVAQDTFGQEIQTDRGQDTATKSYNQILAERVQTAINGTQSSQAKSDASQEAKNAQSDVERTMEEVRNNFSAAPTQEPIQPTDSAVALLERAKQGKSPEIVSAIDRMIADINLKNPKLKVYHQPNGNFRGYYDPTENAVVLADASLRTIAHEVAHALTISDINKHISFKQGQDYRVQLDRALNDPKVPEYIKNLIHVYYHTAEVLGHSNQIGNQIFLGNIEDAKGLTAEQYGFTNLGEFVAEAMSSQNFQNRLAEIPYQGSNAWQSVVDAIAKAMDWIRSVANPEIVLRSNGENALTVALSSARQIIESGTSEDKNNIISPLPNNWIGINSLPDGDYDKIYNSVTGLAGEGNITTPENLGIEKRNFGFDKIYQVNVNFINNQGNDSSYEVLYSLDEETGELAVDYARPINNNIYLPQQTRNARLLNSFKRLAYIKRGNLSDKYDGRTQEIIGVVSKLKNSDIAMLSEELQTYLFDLVDNIYEARKNAVANPQIRIDSNEMITKLNIIKRAVDAQVISRLMADYDEVVDFDSLQYEKGNPESLKESINDYMEKNQTEDALMQQAAKSERAKSRYEKIQQAWRDTYEETRARIKGRYVDKNNFISEYEAQEATPITSPEIHEALSQHYDYLTNVNVTGMKGTELYNHFYAINNLHDGNIMGMQHTTIKFLANQRNTQENIGDLKNTFRDPVYNKNRGTRLVSQINQQAELHQVQLQRASAYGKTREWLNNTFMGRLYDAIMRTSMNRKNAYIQEFENTRNAEITKVGKKQLSVEDRVLTAIFCRLPQFEIGSNPDSALMTNIKKERQSINNQIAKATINEKKSLRVNKLVPFEKAIQGLENYGEGVMEHFMETFPQRLSGTEGVKVGRMRQALIEKTQDIFSRFNTESKIISEGYLARPFNQQAYYVTNDVVFDTTENKDLLGKLGETLDNWTNPFNGDKIKRDAAHYKERKGDIGKGYYSYNIENILGRNVERLAVETATMPEQHIIKERLKKGSDLHNIISRDSQNEYHPNRVDAIEAMAAKLIKNATSRGIPLNTGLNILRAITSVYAKVVLSSPHHIFTQPIAAATDYAVRTGNTQGWFKAATYYAKNWDKVNSWLEDNFQWTAQRGALEAQAIDQRRSPDDDKYESLKSNPFVQFLNTMYEGAGKTMTFFIHQGDNFATKVTLLAEYERLLKEKGYKFESFDDIPLDSKEGRILSEAARNSEKNVNTSNKILRGELFTDRRLDTILLRNLLFAFSAHSSSLATQLNQAVRDLQELKSEGALKGEMESKIRTIAAIGIQQFTFTTARFTFGSLMGAAMVSLVSDLFDDEEGKLAKLQIKLDIERKKGDPVKVIHAEQALQDAKSVRNILTKFKQTTMSQESWFKQLIRDSSGAFHLSFNNGAMQQAVFLIPDAIAGQAARKANEEIVKDYEERIKTLKEKGKLKEAAKLGEQLVVIDAAEYIPLAYPINGTMGLGGLYGSILDNANRSVQETIGAIGGTKEYNYTDFLITAATLGVGQSEVNKTLKLIDKIEDENWKQNQTFQNSELPAAKERKKEKNKIKFPSLTSPSPTLPSF